MLTIITPPESTNTHRYFAQHWRKALTKPMWLLMKKIESLTMISRKWLFPLVWWAGPGNCIYRQFWLNSCFPSTRCRGSRLGGRSRLGGALGRCWIFGRTEQLHKVFTKGGPFSLPLTPPWLRIILILPHSFCTLRHDFWLIY